MGKIFSKNSKEMDFFYPLSLHVTQYGRLGWLSCPVSYFKKLPLKSEIIRMQQKVSCTKSLLYKSFQGTLCITPNIFGYCPGTKYKFPLCVLPLLPSQMFIRMPLWLGSRHPGGSVVSTCTVQRWRDAWLCLPDTASFLGINASHLPESTGEPPGYFF